MSDDHQKTALFDDEPLAYVILRIALGVCMFFHGASWILPGGAPLLPYLTQQFRHTIMPMAALLPFALILPWFELLIGGLTLLGLFTRLVLLAGGLWMSILLAGATMSQNFDASAQQLIYSLLYFVLLTHASRNRLSLDSLVWTKHSALTPT
jgi:thiosulfate dehydrogenase [quinone] large subunit